MKNFKKIASAIAALSLAACVAVPMSATVFTASAEDTTITITKKDDATHSYGAWQIFKAGEGGSVSKDGANYVITDVQWGDGIDSNKIDAVLEKIKEIDGTASDKPFAGVASAADVAKVLGKYTDYDNKVAQAFADAIAGALKDEANFKEESSNVITITEGDEGYYLVQDTAKIAGEGAKTRYILQVAGGEALTPTAKSSYPTVDKKILENFKEVSWEGKDDSVLTNPYTEKFNDVGDFSIAEDITFRLYGTMPDTLADYNHYYYKFTDTFTEGTFKILDTVKDDTVDEKDFTVTIDGKTIDSTCYTLTLTQNEDKSKDTGFTLEFMDILAATSSGAKVDVSSTSKVMVEYHAALTADAVIGLNGQENEVDLEYSNNPNNEGDGKKKPEDTGKTPKETVIAFTYELDVTKYLGDKSQKAEGSGAKQAKFKLYRGSDANKEYAIIDENSKIKGWTKVEADASEVGTGEDGTFKFVGLDDGTYFLTETVVPSGYNKMADKEFTITATTVNDQKYKEAGGHTAASDVLTALKLDEEDGNVNAGTVSMEITNEKGAVLPSTGGIGTTLFYLGGGALVAVAGVMLITKKRMTKE